MSAFRKHNIIFRKNTTLTNKIDVLKYVSIFKIINENKTLKKKSQIK